MPALHEQFLEAIAAERLRLRSRRRFLAGGAKLASGGALALVAVGAPGPRGLSSVAAQDFTDDLDILNYALTLEHLEAAFYRDGLEGFDEDAFAELFGDDQDEDDDEATEEATEEAGERGQPKSVRATLEDIRDNEQAHVEALTDTITQLGGTPVEEAEYDFGEAFDELEAFLETAQALENTGVSAYLGAAPFITDPNVLAAAASIATVEARHAAYLNLQNGDEPFPDAFDEALTRDEVLAIAGEFIVSGGAGAAATTGAGAGAAATTEGGTSSDATEEPTADETAEADVTAEATVDADVTAEATVDADVTAEATVEPEGTPAP